MILRIAREENKLEDVERICIFKSTETFDQLRKNKLIKKMLVCRVLRINKILVNVQQTDKKQLPVTATIR